MAAGVAVMLAWLILAGCSRDNGASAKNDDGRYLTFSTGAVNHQFTVSDLKKKLTSQKVEVYDITFQKKKQYQAFKMQDVLDMAYGSTWRGAQANLTFVALDAFTVNYPSATMVQSGGYIAFDDLDAAGWEPLPESVAKGAMAAPFYAVWEGEAQRDHLKYPWHSQLAIINLHTGS